MNDYRVIFQRDGQEETVELTAETVKQLVDLLPEEAEIVGVKFLRARGFSCRPRGTGQRRQ